MLPAIASARFVPRRGAPAVLIGHRDDDRESREDQQVVAAERLQHERRSEQHRVAATPIHEHAIERVEDQRKELDVLRLQVREARQHVGVERVDQARRRCRPRRCRSIARISRYIDQPESARPAMISRL